MRVYRVRPGWRLFLTAAGGGLLAFAVLGGAPLLGRAAGPGRVILLSCLVLMSLFSVWAVLVSLRARVLLGGDDITVHEPPRRARTLSRAEIAGRRRVVTQHGTILRLEPRRAGTRPIDLGPLYETDQALADWLGSLDDLDAADAAARAAELERSLGLGGGRATLRDALAAPTAAARVLNTMGLVTVIWGLVWPRPWVPLMIVLVALPLVTVLAGLRWSGLLSMTEPRGDPRPTVSLALGGPGLVLALRTIQAPLLSWATAWWMAAGMALALSAGALAADPHARRSVLRALGIAALALPWGLGTIVHVNLWADASPPEAHVAEVLSKRVSDSKAQERLIRLGPWGPVHSDEEVPVRPDVFEGCMIGGEVKILLRRGALGIPWYSIRLR